MKSLLLVDGNNLLFRAYYAFERQRLRTRNGKPSGALFGFARLLLKLLKDESPDYCAVAFDVAKETFRRRLYPEYKAHRKPTPPELLEQMPASRRLVELLGLKVLSNPDFEADDMIGTIAEKMKPTANVGIVSGDRDFLQLLDETVVVKMCQKGITELNDVTPERFRQEYGFAPINMIDFKALLGDSSDNIPGVDGIGEKKAMALVQEHGTIETLYQNLEKVANKRMREQLAAGHDSAVLSKTLATICRDVPGIEDLEIYAWKGVPEQDPELRAFFRDWDFTSLLAPMPQQALLHATHGPGANARAGDGADAGTKAHASAGTGFAGEGIDNSMGEGVDARARATPQVVADTNFGVEGRFVANTGNNAGFEGGTPRPLSMSNAESHALANADEDSPTASYEPPPLKPVPGEKIYAGTLPDLEAFLATLGDHVSLDVETDGFDPITNRIIGFSLAGSPERSLYVPLRHAYLEMADFEQIAPEAAFAALNRALPGKTLIGHNLKFDLAFLHREGVRHAGPFFDTMLAAYVLDPLKQNGLKAIAREQLGLDARDFTDLVKNRPFAQVPIDEATQYGGQDVIVPLILWKSQRERLKTQHLSSIYDEIELPLMPLLGEMELTGIGLNRPYLLELSQILGTRLRELETSIHTHAGYEFNVNSGKQLQEVLFGKLQLEPPRKTKTGFSTDAEVLKSLLSKHLIIKDLLEFRELMKLKSTYVDSLGELVNPKTGLIHTSFNQTVTATGRLSSSHPNMQNIPIKTEWGRRVRRAFTPPRSGDVFISIDYSQIELRLLAHFSADPELLRAYQENLDIHSMTAAKLFGKTVAEVSGDERKIGKTVNFGIIYGISAHGLAEDLAISRFQAQQYIDGFFRMFPGVTGFFESNLAGAKANGFVTTISGRVRPVPELSERSRQTQNFGERVARNTPLQGSAADLVKKAMLDADRLLKTQGFRTVLVLQIHDEIVFSAPPDERDRVIPLLQQCMEQTMSLRVPLVCDVAVGPNLADLQDVPGSK